MPSIAASTPTRPDAEAASPRLPRAAETDWIVRALRGEADWPPMAPDRDATAAILAAAEFHYVRELLCAKLRAHPVWEQLPEGLRNALTRAQHRAAARELFLEKEIAEDLAALAAAGVDSLLLKGTALAYSLYPSPETRPRCDVDLLLPDKDTADAAWHLLEARGYRRGGVTVTGELISHQFSCARKVTPDAGVVLDVHWKISNSNFFARKLPFADLHAARIALPALGPDAYALAPVHALIHALFHRVAHLGTSSLERLIWIYDFDLLCRSFAPAQWQELADQVRHLDLGPICRDGLERAQALLDTPLPPGLLEQLEPADPRAYRQLVLKRPSVLGMLFEIRSIESWRQRIRYVRENLFPSRAYMQARFGASGRLGLAGAYARRFAGGLHKRLFRHAAVSERRGR